MTGVPEARTASRSLLVYAWSLAALGVMALAGSWYAYPPIINAVFVFLVLGTLVADWLAIDLPSQGSTSLAYPLSIAVAVMFGPAAAALAASLGAFNLRDLRRRPALSTALNFGQLAISASAAGWTYLWLGGHTLVQGSPDAWFYKPLTAADFPAVLLPLIAMPIVGIALNVVLVMYGIHLTLDVRLSDLLSDVGWMVSRQLALAAVGISIAQVMCVSRAAFVLFIVPLIVARRVFQHYLELRAAYVDTVRSLVGAVEAKDPYTRGHSERVAQYSTCLGRALRFPQSKLDTLQYAALLHDVGKIGIPMKVLNKPGRLTEDEYRKIKEHPMLGAQVISKVPYLGDIVEAVLYHHEHLDGSGYGRGATAEEIPLLPRVLSIADAYDAMTSARPYRPPLSVEEAAAELRRCSGTQFDAVLVTRFVGMLEAGEPDLMPALTRGSDDIAV